MPNAVDDVNSHFFLETDIFKFMDLSLIICPIRLAWLTTMDESEIHN